MSKTVATVLICVIAVLAVIAFAAFMGRMAYSRGVSNGKAAAEKDDANANRTGIYNVFPWRERYVSGWHHGFRRPWGPPPAPPVPPVTPPVVPPTPPTT